jgi:phosphoribosyl-ATP pyrophosphohydrolase
VVVETLERDLRAIYGAYEYLREHDLAAVSTTSRLLHERDLAYLARRAGDEMEELRGAVTGAHGHGGGRADIVLEAYQTLYWLLLLAVAAGDCYDDVRPHEMLAPGPHVRRRRTTASQPFGVEIALLPQVPDVRMRQQALREGLAIVAGQCHAAGVAVEAAVQRDLAELRSRPYLAPYWDACDRRS